MEVYEWKSVFSVSAGELEQWHYRDGAFERLVPPWEKVRVVDAGQGIRDGSRALLETAWGPLRMRWTAEHFDCEPGVGFSDRQIEGPFASWEHRHEFRDVGPGKSELVDRVSYRLPGGLAGSWAAGAMMRRRLKRAFAYRHAVTGSDLERRMLWGAPAPRTIVVTGASGLVGKALCVYLRMQGHRVLRVTRRPKAEGEVAWDPETGSLNLRGLGRIDGAVHLAGENIASGRWTEAKKKEIRESRRLGTRTLVRSLSECQDSRPVLVSVSGVNYYGNVAAEELSEGASSGDGFLAEVCREWEAEAFAAREAGLRVAVLRLGIVLSPAGGVLGKLLPVFQMGAGGRIGTGEQRMPWVVLDDVVDVMHRALTEETWAGAYNLVAPEIVTNRRFTETLAEVLGRPAKMTVPACAVRAFFGEMGEATLLSDLAVRPARLAAMGHPFRYVRLEEGLRFLLGREEGKL